MKTELFHSMSNDHLFKSDSSLERALLRSQADSSGLLSLGSLSSLTNSFRKESPVATSADSTQELMKKLESELGIDLSSFRSEDITKVFASLNTQASKHQTEPKTTEESSNPKPKQKRWRKLEMQQLNSSFVKPASTQSSVNPAESAILNYAKRTLPRNGKQSGENKKEDTAAPCTSGLKPTPKDVLMGRGSGPANNPGNQKYLALKDAMQSRYMAATKEEKTPISQELFDAVHEWGGRFLNYNKKTKQWFEIDAKRARKKCSQALREINTPEVRLAKRIKYKELAIKKQQQEEDEGSL